MDQHAFLSQLVVYLASAVIAVAIFNRLGLASILGYLVAGSVLGPFGLKVIKDVHSTMAFAELGVVLLLFIIGLELKPSRLWAMRKPVFGIGSAQIVLTSIPFAIVGCLFGLSIKSAIVVAISLAFSSTAFALQILSEKKKLGTQAGRGSFAILLFQDLTAIPLLAAIPALGVTVADSNQSVWVSAAKILAAMAVVVFGGRQLLRPAFRLIASTKASELFTAGALLLVVGVAMLMESIGLSMALGAFLAGVLLADSEYRHELEADIEPFKGLLLGLFFMTVGMQVDYGLLVDHPFLIAGLVLGLVFTKAVVLFGLGKVSGMTSKNALVTSVVLPQGGEFAFVIFGAAVAYKLLDQTVAGILVLVVTLSMALTPFLVLFAEKVLSRYVGKDEKRAFDTIEENENPVIIAGFGRVGQINGRILRILKIGFTALEADVNQVEVLRKFGNKVYYGDASKIELLKAAGAEKASFLVIAVDDMQASIKIVEVAQAHFPHLTIIARARNRSHAYELLDRGVNLQFRETLGSSIAMAKALIVGLGMDERRAQELVVKFKKHDEEQLLAQHKVHHDETALIEAARRGTQQLEEVLRDDEEDAQDLRPARVREL